MSRMRAFMMMAAVAAVAVPMAARAQKDNMPTADQLQARAEALHDSPELYAVAARMYARAAALRPMADPKAVQNLVMAGRLLAYRGEFDRARWAMELAATRALESKDPVAAAYAYLNAAYIAGNYDHDPRALDLVQRVVWLASVPGVAPEQRADVLRRLGESFTPATIALIEKRAAEKQSLN